MLNCAEGMEYLLHSSTDGRNGILKEEEKDGYDISHRTVRIMLQDMGYSMKSNKKSNEGKSEPDRDEQFGT